MCGSLGAEVDLAQAFVDGPGGAHARAQSHQPEQAVADFRQAIAHGFKAVEWLKTDPNLNPLRDRQDFRMLLESLEQKKK